MIHSKKELKEFLKADSKNYKSQSAFLHRLKYNILSTPISEQKYIWLYIKSMRYVEYYQYKTVYHSRFYKIPLIWWLTKLRKYSHITGFQIPPNTCGKGLTIWHWGTIIVNGKTKIGKNCILYPGVLIGHKIIGGECAHIGDNVFIGSGTKIIGPVKIGDNVKIGQNCVIVKDIAEDSTVVCSSNKIIRSF